MSHKSNLPYHMIRKCGGMLYTTDLKCHTEWCASNGLKTEPELLHCADLCFRYLLGSSSRADLDARLQIHADGVVTKLFPGDVEAQAAYSKYLRQTRFAEVGSPGYLANDRKARSHTQVITHMAQSHAVACVVYLVHECGLRSMGSMRFPRFQCTI